MTLKIAGDIAAFISKRMVQGLGLTTIELMLARTSAIKYAGKRDKPTCLVDIMVCCAEGFFNDDTGVLAASFDLATFLVSMIAPVKKTVNHLRIL